MPVSRVRNFRGGDTGDGAAQPFPALSAAQGFAPGGARVGEVEVFHHDRRAVVLLRQIQQRADGGAHPPVTPRCLQPRGINRNGDGFTDRIARGVEHTGGHMVGVEVHPQHRPAPQILEAGHWRRGWFSRMRPDTNGHGRGRR